jgi:toxin-antitoxin system PIN domain toxin
MKLPDTNVLVYAVNVAAPQHRKATAWLKSAFDSAPGVALSWMALVGFVRLTTRPGVLSRPLAVEDALTVMNHWLGTPGAQVVHPGPRHAMLLGRLLLAAGTAGNLTSDAHLAALALEHGATVGTFDRDFRRFAGLDVELLGA